MLEFIEEDVEYCNVGLDEINFRFMDDQESINDDEAIDLFSDLIGCNRVDVENHFSGVNYIPRKSPLKLGETCQNM